MKARTLLAGKIKLMSDLPPADWLSLLFSQVISSEEIRLWQMRAKATISPSRLRAVLAMLDEIDDSPEALRRLIHERMNWWQQNLLLAAMAALLDRVASSPEGSPLLAAVRIQQTEGHSLRSVLRKTVASYLANPRSGPD